MLLCGVMLFCVLGQDTEAATDDLHCPSCEKIHCTPRRPRHLKCKGGYARGICNCCPVCAKVEGETCGGVWDYKGKCDHGLHCQSNSNHMQDTGVCRKGHADKLHATPGDCKPKCSLKYCKRRRNAICSAIDISKHMQACQGNCQHTSCSACHFEQEEPTNCARCQKQDFHCIRKFGTCVKHRKRACKKTFMPIKKGYRFTCMVPQC